MCKSKVTLRLDEQDYEVEYSFYPGFVGTLAEPPELPGYELLAVRRRGDPTDIQEHLTEEQLTLIGEKLWEEQR
jgi:hypothetical protein